MHSIGATILEGLLNADGGGYRGVSLKDNKGNTFCFTEYRAKKVMTVVGSITVKRAYYYSNETHEGYCPKDRDLDVEGSSFSPGVRRIMGRVGAYRPFVAGHDDIEEISGLKINAQEISRYSNQLGEEVVQFDTKERSLDRKEADMPKPTIPIMYIGIDGTGVPVVKEELVDRQGKEGPAKTREAKLGCVFTQTTTDEKGHPVRDELSTTYTGAIENAEEFSERIYGEAYRRGSSFASKVCVLGDGASWIWNIADDKFPQAIQIIDLYHAREHYWAIAKGAFGTDMGAMKAWAKKRKKELNKGAVEKVIAAIQELKPATKEAKELYKKEAAYFERNKERMRYKNYRKQHLFVGSGVVEAGCRTVIGQRLKQSGMHWTVKNANNIIALRSCILSNRWENFWEYRASLPIAYP